MLMILYVCVLQVYDVGGWGYSHSVPLGFEPYGVSLAHDGRLYVGAGYDNKVYRLRLSTDHRTVVKEEVFVEDSAAVELKRPLYVHATESSVFVSCELSDCVREFDHEGRLVSTIDQPGVRGSSEGRLGGPRGVCVDSRGRPCVADWYNRRVLVVGGGAEGWRTLWESWTGGRPVSEPHSVTHDGDRLMVGLRDGNIITYNLE